MAPAKKKTAKPSKKVMMEMKPAQPKSEYELERERNIERNKQIMENLGLNTPLIIKKRAPPSKRKRPISSSEPPRRSSRLSGSSSGKDSKDLVALPDDFIEPPSSAIRSAVQHTTTCARDDLVTLEGDYDNEMDEEIASLSAASYLAQSLEEDIKPKFCQSNQRNFLSIRQSMRFLDAAKLTKERGYSLKFHPERMLLAAGDKRGQIAIWNIQDEQNEYDCVQRFSQLHSKPVTSLTWMNNQLISAGFDSLIRRTDFFAQRSIVLADYEKIAHLDMTLHAAIAADGSFIVASHQDGQVTLLDPRASATKLIAKPIDAHASKCHHVEISNNHRLATAGNDGIVQVFDIRSLTPLSKSTSSKKSLNTVFTYNHSRAVRGCVLSHNGRVLSSLSYDDTILLVNDIDSPTQQVLIKHNNNTGRWLTPFKPCLYPHEPQPIVLVGSMDRPRAIDLVSFPTTSTPSTSGNRPRVASLASSLVHKLHDNDQNFRAVTSIHDVHSAHHLIAGINNSGHVSLWKSSL